MVGGGFWRVARGACWRCAAAGRAFLAAARLITHVVRDRERCLSLRCRALGTHLVSNWRRDRSRGCLVGRRPRPLQVLLPSAVPPPGVAVAAHLPSSGVRDVGGRRLAPFVTHTMLWTAVGDDPMGRCGSTDDAGGGQSRNQPSRSDGRRRGRTPCCGPLSETTRWAAGEVRTSPTADRAGTNPPAATDDAEDAHRAVDRCRDDPMGRWGSTDIADGGQSRNQPSRSDGRR